MTRASLVVVRHRAQPRLADLGLLVIHARESTDVRRVIDVLNAVEGPDLGVVEAHVRQERATPL